MTLIAHVRNEGVPWVAKAGRQVLSVGSTGVPWKRHAAIRIKPSVSTPTAWVQSDVKRSKVLRSDQNWMAPGAGAQLLSRYKFLRNDHGPVTEKYIAYWPSSSVM
jgi:hypothetical protein